MILKGTQGSNLKGLLSLTRMATALTQSESICQAQLGTSHSTITPTTQMQCKNALLAEYAGVLGFDDEAALLMADAGMLAYTEGLNVFATGASAKQCASGATMGIYAGYVSHDGCCGLDRNAMVVTAVISAVCSVELGANNKVLDAQAAWNDIEALGQGS